MADTDIILSVDLDVADADRTAEQLHKEIQKIFQSRNGQQSAALTQLELQMKQNVEKAIQLKQSLDNLAEAKIPTTEYTEVSKRFEKLDEQFNRLLVKQDEMQELGKTSGPAWDTLNVKMEQLGTLIREDQAEMQQLVNTGKAFTLGKDTEDYQTKQRQLDSINDKLTQQVIKHREIVEKEQQQASNQDTANRQIKKTTASTISLRNALEKVRRTSDKATYSMSNGFKNVGGLLKRGIRSLLMWGFGIQGIMSLVRKLRSAITEGFRNLETSKISKYTAQIENLRASISNIKNALAGAFEPIVTSIIPYLQKLIDWLTMAIDKMAQFIAALKGQNTYIKAVKKLGAAVEEAGNKAKGSLANFDKLNNLTSDTSGGSGGGVGGGLFTEDMIDSKILDYIKKLKELIDKLRTAVKPTTDALKKLWNEGLSKFRDFTWTALKDFWENFLVPLGEWAFTNEDTGLPRLINILNDDLNRIDWETWNKNLKEFWIAIEPYAEAVGEGLIDFLEQAGDLAVDILEKLFGKDGILEHLNKVLEDGDPEDARKWTTRFLWLLVGMKVLQTIAGIWTKIKSTLITFIDWLPGAWATVKGILYGIAAWVTANPEFIVMFEGWLEETSPKFKKFVDGVKSAVDELLQDVDFSGFENACKVIGDAIVVLLHGIEFLLWPKSADKFVEDFHSFELDVQKLLDDGRALLSSLQDLFAGFASFTGGINISLPSITGGATTGAGKGARIKGAASGAVIPPTAREHPLIVGDNNKETEVVSPLSTIEQALRNVMTEQNINVTFEVQGDPERIFNVVRKQSTQFTRRTGLGWT